MDSVKSVLIIDDDEDDVLLIEDRLRDLVAHDCHFVNCFERQVAIDYLKERTFDLCILDYRLAGYEGLEILNAVATAELATPIIMLTGQNDDKVAKDAIKAGAQDFVMKASIDDVIFEKSIQYAIARKELEFARVLSQRNKAENTAKDKFIAHLSHELRTPLTSILGYTSLLLENEQTLAFQKELKVISNNGKHLLNLLNDVLDLSKIAAEKFELKERTTNLQQLLVEVNSLLTLSALDKGLTLAFHSENKLPELVLLDDIRFKQVLVNLIGNAIKFTDVGGVEINIALCHASSSAELQFEIIDTGIGMAEHQISSIFSPFKQLEDVTNRKAGGAGLGLAITAEIIKQMGGTLDVESELGKGSRFFLKIPCKALNQSLINYSFNVEYESVTTDKPPQLCGHVLVVDDVFEIRELAGYYVKNTGLNLEFASNGEQALLKVEEAEKAGQPFDAILMDLHMPILSGEEVTQKLRTVGNTASIIAMTAAVSKGLYEELMQIGFNQLIAKPIDKLELWQILEDTFAKKGKNQKTSDETKQGSIIHLVEDDIDSAAVMTMILEQLDYQVLHSCDAQQAIATAKENPDISLHLLDLGLPDLSGKAFLDAFFANTITGQVSVLSGNQPDPVLSEQYPIFDQLVKPVSKTSLKAWLHKHA